MADLNVSSQTLSANAAVVKLEGALDTGNFDALEDEFSKILESGISGVVLDISGLEAFSSSGLGAIINLARILASRDGKLVVAAPRPGVEGTLELLGVRDALSIVDSVDAARKEMAAAIKS